MELIVTADDFGYSPRRDDIIVDCYLHGILTGASLMVNGQTADSAAKRAREIGLVVGLHLNLTEGFPLLDPFRIPSIISDEGEKKTMKWKEILFNDCENGVVDAEDVRSELECQNSKQIQRFHELMGEYPPYLDSHQHIHVIPFIARTIAPIMKKYGITKTRFPSENMDEVGWMNDNPRKPFRQLIYRYSLESRAIYSDYGIYGGYGIGSSIGGKEMSVQRVLNCCMRYPRSQDRITTIEFMTHPGGTESDPSRYGCGIGCDAFSQDDARRHEYHVLTDPHLREFLLDKSIQLTSYKSCHLQREEETGEKKPRVVLMLSLKEGTGNTITGTRLYTHMLHLGYVVQMIDTTDQFEEANIHAILSNANYDRYSRIHRLVCIHAIRAGRYACCTQYPYVIVLGGTDINLNANDPEKASVLNNVLSKAQTIIAFTDDMKRRCISFLPSTEPRIQIIAQSTEPTSSCSSLLRDQMHLSSGDTLLLLPSGLRSVKGIDFVLTQFSSYHRSHPSVYLCIIGPILDVPYANTILSHISPSCIVSTPDSYLLPPSQTPLYEGVFYSKSIPHNAFISVMADADVIINTSVSEGFAAVIVEAWNAGKVIIARRNPGNAAVITDGENGILFNTPEDFIEQLNLVLSTPELREKLVLGGKRHLQEHSLYQKEEDLLGIALNS